MDRMVKDGIARHFWANSTLYTLTNLFQKGAAFLLLPLYTLYLDPHAYGVLAVVTALNGFLAVAFTLALTGAITRFYFEYRDDPALLAEFWGTIITFVTLLSLVMGGLLLVVGEWLLRPLLGEIAFWPYAALGVLATLFQPFFLTFLAVLQTRNQGGRYALISLGHFVTLTLVTIALVVGLGWGVTGALTASLVAAATFFVLAMWALRRDFRLCLRWRHLRPALAYSYPQIPHAVAGQVTAYADRLVLNANLGAGPTGIYAVGAMVAMVVEVAAQSVNRAYVPLGMEALKRRIPAELGQFRALGSLIVAAFCQLGATIGAFSTEIVLLLAAPAFRDAAAVVPWLAFIGVASAIYYLLVNILFFERDAAKFLPIGTLTAAGLSVLMAIFLVPRFGMFGAAVSALVAQVCATLLIGAIAARFDPVSWDYRRYGAAFAIGLACSVWLGSLPEAPSLSTTLIKCAGLVALAAVLGGLFWRRPLILYEALLRLARRRPAEAAALFGDPGPIAP